jgi:hypothetical protein
MLAGYVWLGTSGALWIALGLQVGSSLLYDAALHALFLGFVISMVMGHAPIILPAVLRIDLPYHRTAWIPFALLHVSVAARVGADLLGSTWARGTAMLSTSSASGRATRVIVVASVWIVSVKCPTVRMRTDIDSIVWPASVRSASLTAEVAARSRPPACGR